MKLYLFSREEAGEPRRLRWLEVDPIKNANGEVILYLLSREDVNSIQANHSRFIPAELVDVSTPSSDASMYWWTDPKEALNFLRASICFELIQAQDSIDKMIIEGEALEQVRVCHDCESLIEHEEHCYEDRDDPEIALCESCYIERTDPQIGAAEDADLRNDIARD